MTGEIENGRKATQRVIALLTQALDLLDAHGGSAEAAVYVELALQKLRNRGAIEES